MSTFWTAVTVWLGWTLAPFIIILGLIGIFLIFLLIAQVMVWIENGCSKVKRFFKRT